MVVEPGTWSDHEQSTAPAIDPAKELQKSFARAFATNDGADVLRDLMARTIDTIMPATRSAAELRHLEGSRAIVRYIINQIERGHLCQK